MLTSRPGKIAKNENTRIHRPVRGSSARVEGNSHGPDQTTNSLLDDALPLAKRKYPRAYPRKNTACTVSYKPGPCCRLLIQLAFEWRLRSSFCAVLVHDCQFGGHLSISSSASFLRLIPFSTQSIVISFGVTTFFGPSVSFDSSRGAAISIM